MYKYLKFEISIDVPLWLLVSNDKTKSGSYRFLLLHLLCTFGESCLQYTEMLSNISIYC